MPGHGNTAVNGEKLSTGGHIAALDGLRALAILGVMFVHSGESFLIKPSSSLSFRAFVALGSRGVDLFFALSGFLITGILLDTVTRRDYFRRFYWRRALRIWPLYYAFLITVWIVHHRAFKGIGFAPFAFYYRNFLGSDISSDYTLGHFWSLCVEEQFYLVWPFFIYLCARRFLLTLILTLMALAVVVRISLLHMGLDPYILYRLPICRMDALLSGAAVAVLVRHWPNSSLRSVYLLAIGAGLFCVVFCGRGDAPAYAFRFTAFGFIGYALFFGGIVGLCVAGWNNEPLTKILTAPILRAISTRSYAMYIFHLAPLFVVYKLLERWDHLPNHFVYAYGLIFLMGLLTYGLAWLSWLFFEEPILRLKDTWMR